LKKPEDKSVEGFHISIINLNSGDIFSKSRLWQGILTFKGVKVMPKIVEKS